MATAIIARPISSELVTRFGATRRSSRISGAVTAYGVLAELGVAHAERAAADGEHLFD